jgi:hypothetical protein
MTTSTEAATELLMSETPQETAERLARDRGYTYPEWEYLAERDPVFLDAYNRLSGLGLLHAGVPLEGKQLRQVSRACRHCRDDRPGAHVRSRRWSAPLPSAAASRRSSRRWRPP